MLCRESEYFRELLEDSKAQQITVDFLGAPVFRLYLQWLLAGSYHEYTEFSQAPSYRTACSTHTLGEVSTEDVTKSGEDFVVWCVKAGVLAWKLGHRLQAPRFQNYAMRRLFAAYTRAWPTFQVQDDFFRWTRDSGTQLRDFFEDLVIRNWADGDLIDHRHSDWSRLLKENDRFRDCFIEAMAQPEQERCEAQMEIEKYLLEEK
ncbi:hypothetical protein BDU57DRAFT_523188 [Ampelomyces quisqualis]|uniref:BTB domain-containing protein n=1 Tax=Ampelomyces quisqualis TaxID=50730 RepID=A0A6A5QCE7_AMPQU|nr:hypothetical protein BDU57DRAFT_523188 [Ampelomyces quisqualis]